MAHYICTGLGILFFTLFPFARMGDCAEYDALATEKNGKASVSRVGPQKNPTFTSSSHPVDKGKTPEEIVESLGAKTNNWQEPSARSEERYVLAIRQWLDGMEAAQREEARKILKESHKDMHTLRVAIREKKKELANMSFNRHTSPEALPRLGQELQSLRKTLRVKLEKISERLTKEVGVPMGPLEGDAFWLLPQDLDTGKPKAANQREDMGCTDIKSSLMPMVSMY